MPLWIWILLAVAIVALLAVIVGASRTIRPKPPVPLSSTAPATTAIPALRPSAGAATPLSPGVHAEIDRLVAAGQKITAIKVLREHQPMPLQEAKERIEAWVPGSALPSAPTRPAAAPRLDPSVRAEIDRLIAAEQPIAAIKLLREVTGWGLKDAKDAIDAWREGRPLP